MPFGATFWSTGWTAVKHPHLFPNASLVHDGSSSYYKQYTLHSWTTTECIQGPINAYSGDSLSSLNVGHFIGKYISDSSVVLKIAAVDPDSRGAFSSDPSLITVRLTAEDNSTAGGVTYYPVFSKQSSSGPPDPKFTFWLNNRTGGSSTLYKLYHVQPIAFRGVVSEVVGALLMYAGVDPTYVDQDSFDVAYDAELNAGADNNERPYVWVIPEQGETVFDTIKRVMQHWSHVLAYTREGKIAIMPADGFDEVFAVIDDNSNVISVKTRTNRDLILNKCLAMHGGGYMRRVNYETFDTYSMRMNATYEPHLKSDEDQYFIDEYSASSSITKYGERQFGDRVRATAEEANVSIQEWNPIVPWQNQTAYWSSRTISVASEGDPISVAHYPLIHRKEIKDNIMLRFTTNEAELRTFIEVTQDFMGLDYEIGSIVYVPSEGGDFRCIRQTVDFNLLTVKSTLIRNFPTEYTTASTAIWTYVNLDDAPVGTTALSEAAGVMTLEIDLTTTAGLDWYYQIYISKDGGPWEEFYTTGWEAETANLDIQDTWSGNTQSVEVIIRAADDGGVNDQCTPTPWVRMPTATQ